MKAHVTERASIAMVGEKGRFTRASLSIAICFALLISTAPVFSQARQLQPRISDSARTSPAQDQELNRVLSDYQLLELDLKEMTDAVERTGRLTLQARGTEYELELEPNELRSASFRSTITTDFGVI